MVTGLVSNPIGKCNTVLDRGSDTHYNVTLGLRFHIVGIDVVTTVDHRHDLVYLHTRILLRDGNTASRNAAE